MIEYKVGDIIEGTIIGIKDFGALMIFQDNFNRKNIFKNT